MNHWSIESLSEKMHDFCNLSLTGQHELLEYMITYFPPQKFKQQLSMRSKALQNMENAKNTLEGATQNFPSFIEANSIDTNPESLHGFAFVLTAGGEGERLRLSLQKNGLDPAKLIDFTKATFPLPGFFNEFGTLQINLAMINHFCKSTNHDIPVVITTGPHNSVTARIIPKILKQYNDFGLRHVRVIEQDERLHFLNDEKIAYKIENEKPLPVTQPDETGGPLMKLKQTSDSQPRSILDWFEELGCDKTIVVQATALYHQELLPKMAQALGNHDCLGTGILRNEFSDKDPFGTFVTIKKGSSVSTQILEQEIRNENTRTIKDQSGKFFLPFNTGFYAFRNQLLKNNMLPDYATPPKEVNPSLPRSPKIGYAATDLLPIADNPVILTIDQSHFRVLKTASDLDALSEFGNTFKLDSFCREIEI